MPRNTDDMGFRELAEEGYGWEDIAVILKKRRARGAVRAPKMSDGAIREYVLFVHNHHRKRKAA